MRLDFIFAPGVRFTKTYRPGTDGPVCAASYPLRRAVTSRPIEVHTLAEFHDAVVAQATAGSFLLKGLLDRPLVNESRKERVSNSTPTQWLCLDFDKLPGFTIEQALSALGIGHVSHIIQWSASTHAYGLAKGLSAHVFFLLAKPTSPKELVKWIEWQNLERFGAQISLHDAREALKFPLDPRTALNSQPIYIARPVLEGVPNLLDREPFELVLTGEELLTIDTRNIHRTKVDARIQQRIKELCEAAGRPAPKTSRKGNVLIATGVGPLAYEIVADEGEYLRLNLAGGDSAAYFIAKDHPEHIHNFKGEAKLRTEEVCPELYHELAPKRSTAAANTRYHIVNDRVSAKRYKVVEPKGAPVQLYPVGDQKHIKDFCALAGIPVPDPVPDFDIFCDPRQEPGLGSSHRIINTYWPTAPMASYDRSPSSIAVPPTIQKVLDNAVGSPETQEAFLNWLACIARGHKMPTMWILNGIEGTGKGVIVNDILAPILGMTMHSGTIRMLRDRFNDYLEGKLLVVLQELQLADDRDAQELNAVLKHYTGDRRIEIEAKFKGKRMIDFLASFLATTNQPSQAVLLSESNRRYCFSDCAERKLAEVMTPAEFEQIPNELIDFTTYLMNRTIDLDSARDVHMSETQTRMMEDARDSNDEVIHAIKNGDLEALWNDVFMRAEAMLPVHVELADARYRALVSKLVLQVCADQGKAMIRMPTSDLAVLFGQLAATAGAKSTFGKMLAHRGLRTKKFRDGRGTYRGLEVTWRATPAFLEGVHAEALRHAKLSRPTVVTEEPDVSAEAA